MPEVLYDIDGDPIKARPGRPKLPPQLKRVKSIEVYLSDVEWDRVQGAAMLAEMGMPKFIRRAALRAAGE